MSDKRRRFGDQRQAAGQLRQVPVDRLGLAAERIEPVMVEIGRGEVRVPIGREPPRAVIEALAGDVDIVAVEHAMDEAGGDVARGERRRWPSRRGRTGAAHSPSSSPAASPIELRRGSSGPAPSMFSTSPKKARRWNVPMRIWPWLSRVRTDERVGEGSSPRTSSSPVSNKAKVFDVLTPSASSISVASTSRTPPFSVRRPSAVPAVGGLARALGAEVEQAVPIVAQLGERKPRPSPMSGLYTRNWWP